MSRRRKAKDLKKAQQTDETKSEKIVRLHNNKDPKKATVIDEMPHIMTPQEIEDKHNA